MPTHFYYIAALSLLLPAVLAFCLRLPTDRTLQITIGFFAGIYLVFCLYFCREAPLLSIPACIVYAFISVFGIPYTLLVVAGAWGGIYLRKFFGYRA